MNKILIVGGNGFVGKNMQHYFIANDDYDVSVIDISENGIQSDSINFYKDDLHDVNRLKNLIVRIDPDFIINLVSMVTAERDMSLFQKMLDINFQVFLNLYEASNECSSLKLFIQFGTAEEYGNIPAPMKESDREMPSSPYALVKQLTTNTAIMLNNNYNFPVCIVRPGNLFGPFQGTSKFIPYIISSLKKNETLKVTPCEQKRDFIHVDDLIYCVEALFLNYQKSRGDIFNISSGTSVTLKEVIQFCHEEIDSSSDIQWGAIPYRENEMMDFCVDVCKINALYHGFSKIDIFNRLKQEMGNS